MSTISPQQDANVELPDVSEGALVLNAFWIKFSPKQFQARRFEASAFDLRALWDQYGEDWFFYHPRGSSSIVGLPRHGDAETNEDSTLDHLQREDHLGLLSARFEDELASLFEDQNVERTRPLVLLGEKNLVKHVAWKHGNTPSLVADGFDVRSRFVLDPKIINPADKKPFVALTIRVRSRWNITADLRDLASAGVDLQGKVVRWKDPSSERWRLAGAVEGIDGDQIVLNERRADVPEQIPVLDTQLEGSKENFYHCLESILGRTFSEFQDDLEKRVNKNQQGPSVAKFISRIREFLEEKSPLELTPTLIAELKEQVTLQDTGPNQSIHRANSVQYCFNPSRTKRDKQAWRGLRRFGPFDQDSFGRRSPKILVVCHSNSRGVTEQFVQKVKEGLPEGDYEAGFASTFQLVSPDLRIIEVTNDSTYTASPGRAYRDVINDHLQSLSSSPNRVYDAALVAIEDEDADLPGAENPYLQAKAKLLMAGIPTQQVRWETMRQSNYQLQYTLRNFTTALYAKMGGTPWTVDQDKTVSDELVIGLGTSEISSGRFGERTRLIGITTVFSGDGNYLLGNLSKECLYEDYPDELRRTTTEILSRRKEEMGWDTGDTVRLIFHTFKPLRDIEVAQIVSDCVEEVGDDQNVEFAFLEVSKHHPYVLFDPNQKGVGSDGERAVYVPQRGTIAQLTGRQQALFPLGARFTRRTDEPIRRPLLLKLHRSSTYWDRVYLAEQVFKFTAISWKTVLPIKRPVTIEYSSLIAQELGELRKIPYWSPEPLNSLLRTSRWFL